jgi:hypothetical protein
MFSGENCDFINSQSYDYFLCTISCILSQKRQQYFHRNFSEKKKCFKIITLTPRRETIWQKKWKQILLDDEINTVFSFVGKGH